MILGLIGLVVVTEAFADAFGYVLEPDNPTRIVAVVAGPLSLVLELFGTDVAAWGFAVFAWAHVLAVMAFGTYLPYSKHLHIITSEPNVYLMNLEPRGALRKMDLEADPPARRGSDASARPRSATSPGATCSTRWPAPSAGAAWSSARPRTAARRCRPST